MENLEKTLKDKNKLDIIGESILIGALALSSYLFIKEGRFKQIKDYDIKRDIQTTEKIPYHAFY